LPDFAFPHILPKAFGFASQCNRPTLNFIKVVYMKKFLAAVLVSALCGTSAVAQDASIPLGATYNSTVISSQWVQSSVDGSISGTVVLPGVSNADMSGELILAARETTPSATVVQADGSFVMAGVQPGIYTLVYEGPNAFAAFALHIFTARAESPLSSELTVAASSLVPVEAIRTIARYQPPQTNWNPMIESDMSIPTASGRTNADWVAGVNKVARTESGFKGRMIRAGSSNSGMTPAGMMNVLVFKGGSLVAQTVTDANGDYQFKDLAGGMYNLIGSGVDGFCAVGLELVDPSVALTNKDGNGHTFVSTTVLQAPALVIQVAPADPSLLQDFPPSDDATMDQGFPIDPFAGDPFGFSSGAGGFGGGGGGGVSGGGGGGGGGLGMGGLLAAGALAAAGLSDSNNSNFIPSPASPATP
jgi:hypothetical protein